MTPDCWREGFRFRVPSDPNKLLLAGEMVVLVKVARHEGTVVVDDNTVKELHNITLAEFLMMEGEAV